MCVLQIFEGNTHYDTPELRRFEETLAQFIRIYPERWSPAGIGMRVEILGCGVPGKTRSRGSSDNTPGLDTCTLLSPPETGVQSPLQTFHLFLLSVKILYKYIYFFKVCWRAHAIYHLRVYWIPELGVGKQVEVEK